MSGRTPFIVGNWKLHCTVAEAVALATAVREGTRELAGRDVAVAPVYTALHAVAQALAGGRVRLAAQNLHWEDRGAFTGEVSGPLLRDAGCDAVIVGHSERRQLFGETDAGVNRRALAALRSGLLPIVCVGETHEEREAGQMEAVVARQLRGALAGFGEDQAGAVALAYEPVWAIGTGHVATPAQANEVHALLRRLLETDFGAGVAARVRILYGGSVKPDNVDELMAQPELDGVLVGGASLKADSFLRIANYWA